MMNAAFERKLRQPNRPWAFWLLFFFQYAAFGAFSFLNIYFREAGLSGTQIGLINMTTAVISVGSAIGWGYISDQTGKPRLMIAIGAIGSLVLNQFMPFVNTFWAFLGLS
jgi:PPP family 3-phenylpropionic acid transporter